MLAARHFLSTSKQKLGLSANTRQNGTFCRFFKTLSPIHAGFRGRGRELCANQKTANKRERRPVECSGYDRGSEEVNVSVTSGLALAWPQADSSGSPSRTERRRAKISASLKPIAESSVA